MKSLFTILIAVILFAVYFMNREREKGRKLQLRRGFQPDWSRTGGGRRRRRSVSRGKGLRPDWSRVRKRPALPGPPSAPPDPGEDPTGATETPPPKDGN